LAKERRENIKKDFLKAAFVAALIHKEKITFKKPPF
jgi:hypothetical protein